MKTIIAFSGLPQTGKTTLGRRLASELQCKFVSFGHFVRHEALRRGIKSPTRQDLQNLGQYLVAEDVQGFCTEVLKSVEFSPGEQLVIDGIRHKEVLHAISRVSPHQPIKIIYLSASIATRQARARESDLAQIDEHEVESQVESDIRALADVVIETDREVDEGFRKLIDWLQTNVPNCNS